MKADLEIKPVSWIDQVFDIALAYMPEPFVIQDGANSSDTERTEEKTHKERINGLFRPKSLGITVKR